MEQRIEHNLADLDTKPILAPSLRTSQPVVALATNLKLPHEKAGFNHEELLFSCKVHTVLTCEIEPAVNAASMELKMLLS